MYSTVLMIALSSVGGHKHGCTSCVASSHYVACTSAKAVCTSSCTHYAACSSCNKGGLFSRLFSRKRCHDSCNGSACTSACYASHGCHKVKKAKCHKAHKCNGCAHVVCHGGCAKSAHGCAHSSGCAAPAPAAKPTEAPKSTTPPPAPKPAPDKKASVEAPEFRTVSYETTSISYVSEPVVLFAE